MVHNRKLELSARELADERFHRSVAAMSETTRIP
jgi:hypothetical protein